MYFCTHPGLEIAGGQVSRQSSPRFFSKAEGSWTKPKGITHWEINPSWLSTLIDNDE
jgi:hypothetical protein